MQKDVSNSYMKRSWYIFACLGLGFCIACTETYRYTTLLTTHRYTIGLVLSRGAILILFTFIMILLLRNKVQLHRSKIFISLTTLCIVLKLLLQFALIATLPPKLIMLIVRPILEFGELGLFAAYAGYFYTLGVSTAVRGFSIALFVAGSIQLVVAFMQHAFAIAFILCFGILSGIFLYASQRNLKNTVDAKHRSFQRQEAICAPGATNSLSYKTLLIFLLLLPFILASTHANWIDYQDRETVSLLIQVSAAFGAILAGNVALWMRRIFENPESMEFFKTLILAIGIGAFCLSTSANGKLVFAYIIPLNIAQGLVLLLLWIGPLIYATKRLPLEDFVINLIVFYAGTTLQITASVALVQKGDIYTLVTGCVLFILVAFGILSFLKTSMDSKSRINGTGFQRRFNVACEEVAKQYHLTEREQEVFSLLAKGRTAEYIANALTISHSTARTHIMHIYQKMDLNSQQKLMNLVESRAEIAIKSPSQ